VLTVTPAGTDVDIATQYGTLSIQVPPSSFSGNVQLVIANASAAYSAPLSNRQVSVSFLVAIYQDGVKMTGRFLHPITVEMAIPFIHQGDQIYVKSSGAWERSTSAAVRDGFLRIQIWSDSVIAVLSAKSEARTIVLPQERSASVASLQTFLSTRGYGLAVDGIYGPITFGATKRFQIAHQLAGNGIVGPRTWAILAKTAPAPYPSLSLGAKSPAVNTLRKLLISRGFNVAKYGRFDRSLYRAVKTFQTRNHLPVTGVAARGFWNRIGVQ
jgi:murein L,D-transpeptidase YcbB/YkuD